MLARGRSGVGFEAGEKKLSVTEDVDRDGLMRARLGYLAGVRERGRLAARRNTRMTGGFIFCEDQYVSRVFADAAMVGGVSECSRLCVSSMIGCERGKWEV